MSGALFVLFAVPGLAQSEPEDDGDDIELDDEIDIDESDEEPAKPTTPPPPPAEPVPGEEAAEEDESELDTYRDTEEVDTDLLGEEEIVPVSGDSEAEYRQTAARLSRLGPDEEIAGWEDYLARYPTSAFRTRIEARTEELMDQLYASGGRPGGEDGVDALDAEILLAHPLQLENINPRSRIEFAFEWGLPDYMNLIVDYEHQLQRTLSAHAGIRRRYQGWNVELGPRWAVVKSTRTQTLLTLFADFHLNTNPVYPGLKPQIALGKKFGKLHAQIQGGPDFELRRYDDLDGARSELQVRIVGGANLYYAAAERVGLFAEAYANTKIVGSDGNFETSVYQFNVATFGLKFYPASDMSDRPTASRTNASDSIHRMEVNVGASIPFMQQYWQYHFGSVMGQFNYYL